MKHEQSLRHQCRHLLITLDERGCREWAVSEAMAIGRGGIALVHRACRLSRTTIIRAIRAIREINEREAFGDADALAPRTSDSSRRDGVGRPKKTGENPALLDALESLLELHHQTEGGPTR